MQRICDFGAKHERETIPPVQRDLVESILCERLRRKQVTSGSTEKLCQVRTQLTLTKPSRYVACQGSVIPNYM